MQSFIQMLLFALVSGVVAPLLFDSAFKLACGVMAGLLLSSLCWIRVRLDARTRQGY
jgi:DHA1 family bicyclomycin/chloramphenicol resistance-like MFS transporter